MSEHLYPAPLNALGPPYGPSGKAYQGRRLVLARLVWPHHTDIVPAVALWAESGRVCVEWHPRRGLTRQTWLAEDDVRTRLRLIRSQNSGNLLE